MTITRADLAIFKPELTGNSDDAGGQRSGTKLVSGKLNDLFTPISDIDHAQSAIHIAKCYPALNTSGTETLLGAHVFINQPPVDPLVSVTVVEADALNDGSRKADMVDILESSIVPGDAVTLNTSGESGVTGLPINSTTFRTYGGKFGLGEVLVIATEYTGTESETWPRFTHYCKVTDTTDAGGGYIDHTFEPALPKALPANTVSINSQTNCGKFRRTINASGTVLKFHGVTKLTAIAAAAATTLSVAATTVPLVPTITTQIPTTTIYPFQADSPGNVTACEFTLRANNPKLDTLFIQATIDGTLRSVTANIAGVITSTHINGTVTNGVVSLTFTGNATNTTIRYSVTNLLQTSPPASALGVDPLRLPNSGNVTIFRQWGVVAIQHSQYQAVTSPAPGQTKTIRTNARFADITDATGASLWTVGNTHYSVDIVAGTVTINSNFPGFTAPFTLTDTIGELAMVSAVGSTSLTLVNGLAREYPINATVASVQNLNDLQAYHDTVFDMTAWSGDWNSTGSPASADLNNEAYPIEMNNKGAINEDWAIIFTSSSAFRLVGKSVGQVAIGDTLNDFIPMNTLVSQPYFIIRQEAFGTGWNAGEVIRFKTYAASKPIMLVRSVQSGHSNITTDRALLSFRGNEA